MKKIYRTTAFLMALTMLFSVSGCGTTAKSEKSVTRPKGGYQEEELMVCAEYYGGTTELCSFNDTVVSFSLYEKNRFVISKNGERISQVSMDISKYKTDLTNYSIIAGSDHGLVIYDFQKSGYYFVDINSKITKIDTFLNYAEFSDDGRLFYIRFDDMNGRLNLYELNTKNFKEEQIMELGNHLTAMDVVNDHLIVTDEKSVHMYDLSQNTVVEAPAPLTEFFKNYDENYYDLQFDMCSGKDDDMYIVCRNGLFHYAMNGNQIEKLIDGLSCSLGDPSNQIVSVFYQDDGSIFVNFQNDKIVKYTYDPEMINEKESDLKIYSLENNDCLSQMIVNYAAENRNVNIDYQIGMHSGITYEEAIKELTANILSGNAPDVIMLDGLDINNMADNNMLADLNKCRSKWEPECGLLSNITEWNKKGGHLYSVATQFRIPAIAADKNCLDKIESFKDAADYMVENRKKCGGDEQLMMAGEDSLLKSGLIYEADNIFANNSINKSELETLYDSFIRIVKSAYPDGTILYSGILGCSEFTNELSNAYITSNSLATGTVDNMENDVYLLNSLDTMVPSPGKQTDIQYGIGSKTNLFVPTCNLGIVEAGKNRSNAEKFIASALEAENQHTGTQHELPVNCDTLEWYYMRNEKSYDDVYTYTNFYSFDNKSYNINVEYLTNREAKEFDDYIRTLSQPVYIDKATENIIVDAGIECILNNVSPSDAAENAARQLELKMKE